MKIVKAGSLFLAGFSFSFFNRSRSRLSQVAIY